jgi:hypothetical protein
MWTTVTTMLTLGLLALIVLGGVTAAWHFSGRRKRIAGAAILQSHLADALARETLLHGSRITPRARVSGWRGSRVMIEVAGEVPTPELRETAMRVARAEVGRLRPDVMAADFLFIVPPVHRPSDSLASRG